MDSAVESAAEVCLCLMCGIPGCGKSTLSQQLLEGAKDGLCVWHVCYDDHILDPQRAQYNHSNDLSWKQERRGLEERVEAAVQSRATDLFQNSMAEPSTVQVMLDATVAAM